MKAITQFKIQKVDYTNLKRNQKILAISYLTPCNEFDKQKQNLFIKKYQWFTKQS